MLSRKILMLIGLLSYIFCAAAATEIGPSLSAIRLEFELSGTVVGLLASLQALGGVFALLGGVLSDFFGKARLVAISLGVMGIGTLLISSSYLSWILGASFFIFGIGIGFFEASVNAFISDVFHERRGMAINILHIGWNMGSAIGPPLVAFMIISYGSWRLGYLAIAPLLIVLSTSMWLLLRKPSETLDEAAAGRGRMRLHFIWKVFPLMIISFLIVSSELGITAWLPSILIEEGGSLAQASLTVGAFWALGGIGRLVWSPFIDKLGYRQVLLLTGGGAAFLMILASLPIPIYLKAILWSGSGLLLGPAYPTLVAWVTASNPEIGGTLSGTVFTFATLGSFTSTILAGLLFDVLGSAIAQLIFPFSMAAVATISYLARAFAEPEKGIRRA